MKQSEALFLFPLDVEHGSSLSGDHAFQRDPLKGLAEITGDVFPCHADCGSGFSLSGDRALEEGGIDSFDDLTEGNSIRWPRQKVSARFSAAAVHQSCAAEIIEDLNKKIS